MAGKPEDPRPATPCNGKTKWPDIIDGGVDDVRIAVFSLECKLVVVTITYPLWASEGRILSTRSAGEEDQTT